MIAMISLLGFSCLVCFEEQKEKKKE